MPTRCVSVEVALCAFKAESLTQPLPVSKAPELENSEFLDPQGRHTIEVSPTSGLNTPAASTSCLKSQLRDALLARDSCH